MQDKEWYSFKYLNGAKKRLKEIVLFQQDLIFGMTEQGISQPNGKMQNTLIKAIEANQEVIYLMQSEIDRQRKDNITLWLDDVL
jgi:hypothetical protein